MQTCQGGPCWQPKTSQSFVLRSVVIILAGQSFFRSHSFYSHQHCFFLVNSSLLTIQTVIPSPVPIHKEESTFAMVSSLYFLCFLGEQSVEFGLGHSSHAFETIALLICALLIRMQGNGLINFDSQDLVLGLVHRKHSIIR